MILDKKERELWWLDTVRTKLSDFPSGIVCISERPDFIINSSAGLVGIELTRIHQKSANTSRAQESERQKLADKASLIFEQLSPIKLHVSIHIGGYTAFSNRNIEEYADKVVQLVIANMPIEGSWKILRNPYNDRNIFPYEFSNISIARNAAFTRNLWTLPSGGFVQEDFVPELKEVIAAKDKLLRRYHKDCVTHWLVIVAENNSPSTLLEPSEATLTHIYCSGFNRIIVLDALRQKVHNLVVSDES